LIKTNFFDDLAENIGNVVEGFQNTIQESFFFIEKFVHMIELSFLSLTFVILVLLFFVTIIAFISSPFYIHKLLQDSDTGFSKLLRFLTGIGQDKNVFQK